MQSTIRFPEGRCAAIRRKTLRRERVNRALESIFRYAMTVVEAPMGYGKTTAVREFLAAKGTPVLWLSFLSADDALIFFWDGFAREISRVDEAAGLRLKSLGFPADAPQTAMILSILSGIDYKENTVLVIDDFHLVKDGRIGALLGWIVREELDGFHLVVVTRDTSNLDVAELSAKGLCAVLPQQTLRFTGEEIRAYCDLMGFSPGEDGVKAVAEYTGGWIALAYLTLLGMERGVPMGRNSAIDELVETVLYDTYGGDIRRFLLGLSVMDSFTAEQARYVTRESQTEEFLKKLRRENAFVAYDEAAGAYQIHHVLLDFLRARQTDATELASLYRRLGEWHLARGAVIPAYENLNRAGETERILSILDNPDNVTNSFAEFDGSLSMFARTPRALLFKYPIAYLQNIGLLLTGGDPGAAQDGVARLDELQEFYAGMESLPPGRKNRVLAEISVIRIFAEFNDAKRILACAAEALRLLQGGASVLMKRDNEFTFGSPHFLYSYYREPGQLKEITDLVVKEFPCIHRLADGLGAGCDYEALAEFALETLDTQEAELNAFKAIHKANTKGQTGIAICAGLTLTRLYIYQRKTNEALEYLRRLRSDVVKENNAVYNTTLELVEGYVYGCLAQPDSIPVWLQAGDMSPARFLYQGMAFNYIVYGKAVLLSKDYIQLEILTGEFAGYFSILHNQLGFIHNRIFEAAAKYRLYGMEAGCAALRQALDQARPDHIVLPFAEYAPDILDMARHIARSCAEDAYLQEVLRSCEHYMKSLKNAAQNEVPLSAREREVLALAAEGLKRDEIAAGLGVSQYTVKTHLERIYRKLAAGGRVAAVRKAQKLGLI